MAILVKLAFDFKMYKVYNKKLSKKMNKPSKFISKLYEILEVTYIIY